MSDRTVFSASDCKSKLVTQGHPYSRLSAAHRWNADINPTIRAWLAFINIVIAESSLWLAIAIADSRFAISEVKDALCFGRTTLQFFWLSWINCKQHGYTSSTQSPLHCWYKRLRGTLRSCNKPFQYRVWPQCGLLLRSYMICNAVAIYQHSTKAGAADH